MAETDHAVVVEGLTRRFGDVTALEDVSLQVMRGEVLALLGHNGAGKTTLIRSINGLLRPHAGKVRTLGMDPFTHGQLVREATGVLTEYPALDAFLTARENLEVHGAMHALSDQDVHRRSRALLNELGLLDKAGVQARALSAGLKQRVALARALLHDPALLLLDEPTSNLDPLAARQVRQLVSRLAHEDHTAVVISTHNLAEAAMVADRVAVIQHGRILAIGSPAQLAPADAQAGVAITLDRQAVPAGLDMLTSNGFPTAEVRADGTTIELRTTRDHVPKIVSELVQADLPVHAVVPMEPTLEDIYVALHEGSTS